MSGETLYIFSPLVCVERPEYTTRLPTTQGRGVLGMGDLAGTPCRHHNIIAHCKAVFANLTVVLSTGVGLPLPSFSTRCTVSSEGSTLGFEVRGWQSTPSSCNRVGPGECFLVAGARRLFKALYSELSSSPPGRAS